MFPALRNKNFYRRCHDISKCPHLEADTEFCGLEFKYSLAPSAPLSNFLAAISPLPCEDGDGIMMERPAYSKALLSYTEISLGAVVAVLSLALFVQSVFMCRRGNKASETPIELNEIQR